MQTNFVPAPVQVPVKLNVKVHSRFIKKLDKTMCKIMNQSCNAGYDFLFRHDTENRRSIRDAVRLPMENVSNDVTT